MKFKGFIKLGSNLLKVQSTGFFDYGIVSENEIIPVSNQATELPNLIHVFPCSTLGQTKILSLVQGQMAM